ncbi:GCN5-related N-acetyltransferase [Stanieria cyanosphaera PCC 7437]|uniref:GCN5-related N-acetyltransferase n=2 Tax=Stanieria cyanosphaera TaxID=102116 RepID=K9XXW1_STAC7|nr:GCN5-related N-acetyltransferase [Stanieria cyanosphaera PCC 7437]
MNSIKISLLQESELPKAEKLLRLSFGTFLGLSEPMNFGNGAEYTSRWYREPLGAFAAKADDQLIGFCMLANWGSCAGFGPIVTHPDYWDQGIGSQLITASWSKFDEWKSQQIIFCTHANSPKHIYFYGKFGAEPRFLIALCTKSVLLIQSQPLKAIRYSQLSSEQQAESLNAAYQLTDQIYEGLDWRSEILLVQQRFLGDTLLIWDDTGLIGFAICHYGTGSEAAKESCYVKLAAAKSATAFEQLIEQCETFSLILGMSSLVAGVDTACVNAYRLLLAKKFRIAVLSVSIHKPNQTGYSRPDVYVIEDKR